MSCPINWSLRIKRKDGKPISSDEIEAIFNNESWNNFLNEDDFTIPGAGGKEWEAAFFTESLMADADIMNLLKVTSSAKPEYLFQTERDYGNGECYQNNYRDGITETMRGYIVYGDPISVEY